MVGSVWVSSVAAYTLRPASTALPPVSTCAPPCTASSHHWPIRWKCLASMMGPHGDRGIRGIAGLQCLEFLHQQIAERLERPLHHEDALGC
jgi:hypothetical protein